MLSKQSLRHNMSQIECCTMKVYRYNASERANAMGNTDEESNTSWKYFLRRKAWQAMEILGQIVLFLAATLAITT